MLKRWKVSIVPLLLIRIWRSLTTIWQQLTGRWGKVNVVLKRYKNSNRLLKKRKVLRRGHFSITLLENCRPKSNRLDASGLPQPCNASMQWKRCFRHQWLLGCQRNRTVGDAD